MEIEKAGRGSGWRQKVLLPDRKREAEKIPSPSGTDLKEWAIEMERFADDIL
jgi:hypothetical protein